MRLLSLSEVLVIAQAVTGIEAETLIRVSRIELLESAIAASEAGFGEHDLYPDFFSKASVLCSRIVRNHPLPDGNKRLGWMALNVFCDLNGYDLALGTDEAVATIQSLAAGNITEEQLSDWIRANTKQRP